MPLRQVQIGHDRPFNTNVGSQSIVDLDHHANPPRGLQIQYLGLAPSLMDGRSQQMPPHVPNRPWQNKAGTTQLSLPGSCFSAGEPESGTEFRDTHGSGFGHWSAVGRLGCWQTWCCVNVIVVLIPHKHAQYCANSQHKYRNLVDLLSSVVFARKSVGAVSPRISSRPILLRQTL